MIYEFIPKQCEFCGLRLPDAPSGSGNSMAEHLDWHFQVNKRKQQRTREILVRLWFLEEDDWIQQEVTGGVTKFVLPEHIQAEIKEKEEEQKTVEKSSQADESQPNCAVSTLKALFCFNMHFLDLHGAV
jgi:hypothetical protein